MPKKGTRKIFRHFFHAKIFVLILFISNHTVFFSFNLKLICTFFQKAHSRKLIPSWSDRKLSRQRVNDWQVVISSPVSISTTAILNSRILWGFFNREGFLRSTIQKDKLKVKEVTAITQNDTSRAWSKLLEGGGLGLTVDGGREVMLPSMLRQLKSLRYSGGWMEGSLFSICNRYKVCS